MTDHAADKAMIVTLLTELADSDTDEITTVLGRSCHADTVWNVFHPFNTLAGVDAVSRSFWSVLKDSFPDYEQRPGVVIAGGYRGSDWVSVLSHVVGNFERPWVGIPPTYGICFLRFGLHARIEETKIAEAYVFLDVIDVMRQAGYYPLRRMPGSPEQWPPPPIFTGSDVFAHDVERGAQTLATVLEMQEGLGFGQDLFDIEHSPHWHQNMNWYGPAGIGSSRGQRGFEDYHCALFDTAFPDAADFSPETAGPGQVAHHFIQVGDGHFAVTGGWPSLIGTHVGAGWLGMVASRQVVTMRVADWYRNDEDNLIVDNWVMIDIPDILRQAGYDLLDDMRYFVDPALRRWPR